MKRGTMAALGAVALVAAAAGPARALFGVGDTVFVVNQPDWFAWAGEWAQDAARWGQQLEQGGQVIRNGMDTVNRLDRAYEAVTRPTGLGSAFEALSLLGMSNPLPTSGHEIQALVGGTGGVNGSLGTLSRLMQGVGGANRVYRPEGDAWVDRQAREAGSGWDAAQAMMLTLYERASEGVPLLDELRARIDTENDPAGREGLIARLGYENARIATDQVRAMTLAGVAQAQAGVRQQRNEERMLQSIDQALSGLRASGAAP